MKRGPKPKPAHLRILNGNPSRRPIQVGPICDLTPGAPPKPPELFGEAAAEWDRIIPELEAVGMLTQVDRAALMVYCQAWAEWRGATEQLQAEGRIVEEPIQNSRGELLGERKRVHPAVRLQKEAFERVARMLKEFGLTPAARDRLAMTRHTEGGAEKAVDALTSLESEIRTIRHGG